MGNTYRAWRHRTTYRDPKIIKQRLATELDVLNPSSTSKQVDCETIVPCITRVNCDGMNERKDWHFIISAKSISRGSYLTRLYKTQNGMN